MKGGARLPKEITYIGVAARKSGKRSGKDTWADAFIEKANAVAEAQSLKVNSVKVSLADPLKAAAKILFGLTDEQMYGTQDQKESSTAWYWKQNKYGKQGAMTARDILQFFGTEIMREGFDFDFWVKSLQVNVDNLLHKNKKVHPDSKLIVLVPDVRFPNESVFLDILIDIYRKEAELANVDGHISEKSGMLIPDSRVDYSVDNNSSIVDLQENAKEFAVSILKEYSA